MGKIKQSGIIAVAWIAALCAGSNANAGSADGTWTGFYAGGSLGIAGSTFATSPLIDPSSIGHTFSGLSQSGQSFSIGANAGYDKQIRSFVIGAYGELDYLHIATTGNWSENGELSPWGSQAGDLLGSARIKLGVASENVMFYGSGGVAFANSGIVGWNYEDSGPLDFPNNNVGYVFGGGVEWRLNHKLSVDMDFSRYVFSGSNTQQEFSDEQDFSTYGANNTMTIDLLKVGMNYRF